MHAHTHAHAHTHSLFAKVRPPTKREMHIATVNSSSLATQTLSSELTQHAVLLVVNHLFTPVVYHHLPSLPSLHPLSSFCSRGVCANCADFFGFTCCQDSRSRVDWTKTYDMPKSFVSATAKTEDNRNKVKFPMPYSSSWDPRRHNVGEHQGEGSTTRSWSNGYLSSDDEQTCKQQFSSAKEYTI